MIVASSISPINKNWGDDVSTQIVKCINPKLNVIPQKYIWDFHTRINYLCIGSIVSWMTSPRSVIWGSGCVYPEQKISAKPLKVLAVRGPLTREYLLKQEINCPEVYGDPALLFPKYYIPTVDKKYRLGIIPHFRDKANPSLKAFCNKYSDLTIIDVQNVRDWHSFIDRICECECICSSSLHGVIVSDAYGIPNLWIEFEKGEHKPFAFHDYYMSVRKDDIERPFIIGENSSLTDLIQLCKKKWRKPEIDLEKLYSVCPFLEDREKSAK